MFFKECDMTRLASMIIPLAVAAAALIGSAAQAGDYYERTGDGYRPADGARFSSSCCYKKITKRITITRTVWVKVAPPPRPRPHHVEADDDVVEAPRPAPHAHHHRPQVVELGEVIRRGDRCRKPVRVRDGGAGGGGNNTIIVMVNVRCR
jgi:hypothetical protein